jgi:hypothetical protein
MFPSSTLATVFVNLLSVGSTTLVLRRTPTRGMRRLIWTTAIVSTAQLANHLYGLPGFQWIVAVCSSYAFYLIYHEARGNAPVVDRFEVISPERGAKRAESTERALVCIHPRRSELRFDGPRFFIDARGKTFDKATVEPFSPPCPPARQLIPHTTNAA